jgi:hypothetical protein
MGDGMLAEFGSVVDAVECAVSLQRGFAERNANVPKDRWIQVRIGINLGEVIVEGDDRYGEGVNIAARLEQLADPGGICVSGKVAREVEKKLAFGFESMGAQQLKNIAEPVQAFRVKLDRVPVKRMAPVSPKRALPWVMALMVVVLLAGVAWLTLRARDETGDSGRKALARRAALRQSERQRRARLPRGRNYRGFDHRACGRAGPLRYLAQCRLHL